MWEPWGCEHPDLWRHPDLAGAAPRGADLDRRSLPVPGVRRAPGGAHQRARGRADRPRRSRDRAPARGPPGARRTDRIRPVARRDRTRGVRPRRRSARDHAGRGSSRFPDRARGPPARRRRVAGSRGGRVHRPPAAEVGGGDEGHPPCRRGRAGGDGRRGGDAPRGRDRRRSTDLVGGGADLRGFARAHARGVRPGGSSGTARHHGQADGPEPGRRPRSGRRPAAPAHADRARPVAARRAHRLLGGHDQDVRARRHQRPDRRDPRPGARRPRARLRRRQARRAMRGAVWDRVRRVRGGRASDGAHQGARRDPARGLLLRPGPRRRARGSRGSGARPQRAVVADRRRRDRRRARDERQGARRHPRRGSAAGDRRRQRAPDGLVPLRPGCP